MREPRRDHYIAPAAGVDSRAALDTAIDALAAARNLDGADAATALHLLASLAAETDARFPEAIAKARHDGCSWAGIADLLGVTRASAWQRWGSQERPAAQAAQPDPAPETRPTRTRAGRGGQNVTRSRSTPPSPAQRASDAKNPATPKRSSRQLDQMSNKKG